MTNTNDDFGASMSEIPKMMTAAESAALPEETKLAMLKEAKPGTWYDGWRPYCMMCSSFARMEQHDYGFRCSCCKNMIGWDCARLLDSPFNEANHRSPAPQKFDLSPYREAMIERPHPRVMIFGGFGRHHINIMNALPFIPLSPYPELDDFKISVLPPKNKPHYRQIGKLRKQRY